MTYIFERFALLFRNRRVANSAILSIVGLIFLSVLYIVGGGDIQKGLVYYGIQVLEPSFADLRMILAGVECTQAGHDVLVDNPCDPWKRPVNYPRLWVEIFGFLGLGLSATKNIGLLLIALMIGCFLYLFRNTQPKKLYVVVLCVFSPSVMFLLERGNNDIFVFLFLFLAVVTWCRYPNIGTTYVSPVLIGIAAVFKFFPIAALILTLKQRNRAQIACGIAIGAIVVIYVFLTFDDITKMLKATSQKFHFSFGRDVIVYFMSRQMEFKLPASELYLYAIPIMLIALLAAALVLKFKIFPAAAYGNENAGFFIVGASIFIFSFLMLTNWDYRLVFLLFCVPQIIDWLHLDGMRGFARTFMVSIAIALWSGFLIPTVFFLNRKLLIFPSIDELANWTVCTLSLIGLAVMFRKPA